MKIIANVNKIIIQFSESLIRCDTSKGKYHHFCKKNIYKCEDKMYVEVLDGFVGNN